MKALQFALSIWLYVEYEIICIVNYRGRISWFVWIFMSWLFLSLACLVMRGLKLLILREAQKMLRLKHKEADGSRRWSKIFISHFLLYFPSFWVPYNMIFLFWLYVITIILRFTVFAHSKIPHPGAFFMH